MRKYDHLNRMHLLSQVKGTTDDPMLGVNNPRANRFFNHLKEQSQIHTRQMREFEYKKKYRSAKME